MRSDSALFDAVKSAHLKAKDYFGGRQVTLRGVQIAAAIRIIGKPDALLGEQILRPRMGNVNKRKGIR